MEIVFFVPCWMRYYKIISIINFPLFWILIGSYFYEFSFFLFCLNSFQSIHNKTIWYCFNNSLLFCLFYTCIFLFFFIQFAMLSDNIFPMYFHCFPFSHVLFKVLCILCFVAIKELYYPLIHVCWIPSPPLYKTYFTAIFLCVYFRC